MFSGTVAAGLEVSRMWKRSWNMWMSRVETAQLISSYFHNDMWWFYPWRSLELCSELWVAHVILPAEKWAITRICDHARTHANTTTVRTSLFVCTVTPSPIVLIPAPCVGLVRIWWRTGGIHLFKGPEQSQSTFTLNWRTPPAQITQPPNSNTDIAGNRITQLGKHLLLQLIFAEGLTRCHLGKQHWGPSVLSERTKQVA